MKKSFEQFKEGDILPSCKYVHTDLEIGSTCETCGRSVEAIRPPLLPEEEREVHEKVVEQPHELTLFDGEEKSPFQKEEKMRFSPPDSHKGKKVVVPRRHHGYDGRGPKPSRPAA